MYGTFVCKSALTKKKKVPGILYQVHAAFAESKQSKNASFLLRLLNATWYIYIWYVSYVYVGNASKMVS